MRGHDLGDRIPTFETDLYLQRIIALHRDHLVLGWMSDDRCVPAWGPCNPMLALPKGFDKFAYGKVSGSFRQATTTLVTIPTITANLDGFDDAAAHSGYFLGWPDPDDVIRRTVVAVTAGGHVFPSLPLEMARVGLGEELETSLDDKGEIASVRLGALGPRAAGVAARRPADRLPRSRLPPGPFPWVPAMQLIGDDDDDPVRPQRSGADRRAQGAVQGRLRLRRPLGAGRERPA